MFNVKEEIVRKAYDVAKVITMSKLLMDFLKILYELSAKFR